jgi:hypothetical protein
MHDDDIGLCVPVNTINLLTQEVLNKKCMVILQYSANPRYIEIYVKNKVIKTITMQDLLKMFGK